MKVAIVTSNLVKIGQETKKGSEIFVYILINNLVKAKNNKELNLTAFCSEDSDLPIKTESIDLYSTSFDTCIPDEKRIIFELALISKAFSMQEKFDLYHMNIGNGDIILPFAQFVKKPILITLHFTLESEYIKRYFSLFKDLSNVYFISISSAQRNLLPDLNYIKTIHHGIDVNNFKFNPKGGEKIMWSGRAIPEKGMDVVLEVVKLTKKKAHLFALHKKEEKQWLQDNVLSRINKVDKKGKISIKFDYERLNLIKYYQKSKVFLFPVQWEEPFGLVMVESLSCGTPVIAFARGSIPEIIKDGETGFIVNQSANYIRGKWIIKKTGIAGLQEAVEKIYSMSKKEYEKMRQNCRSHVEKNFTVEKMRNEYIKVYKKLMAIQK